MEDYTFFKTPTGAIYGVSSRVMEAGFSPADGAVEATPEERDDFLTRASNPQEPTVDQSIIDAALTTGNSRKAH